MQLLLYTACFYALPGSMCRYAADVRGTLRFYALWKIGTRCHASPGRLLHMVTDNATYTILL
jgi:hypothetical protein